MILHIDCNAFFASCEVSLRPDLADKPVVVANCNEAGGGIILALTKEAKAVGLKRGDPVFKVTDIINRNNVTVFPANLSKYADISRRLMQVVRDMELVLNLKQYSIDEFFGELPTSDSEELRDCAGKIKRHIEHCTGIPVSCGISLSYTLAKVATWYSKNYKGYHGVCVLPEDKIAKALKDLPIGEIWGIGRRTAPKLKAHGISTALDFHAKAEFEVQRLLGINGVRTWKELHGVPSVDIDNPEQQKSILHSRTFTYMIQDLETLKSMIAEFAVASSRKLRDQHSVCLAVTTFICTNHHREDLEQYDNSATTRLSVATCDTQTIVKAANEALNKIYRAGFQYKRAGVLLSEITGDDAIQLDLFSGGEVDIERSKRLMSAVDNLTAKYGMEKIGLAVQSFGKRPMNLNNLQPLRNQTTDIADVIEVK